MTVRSKTIWIIALVLAIAVCGTVFAAILFSFKVDGNVDGDTGNVNNAVSVEVTAVPLDFANPGDSVDVPITVSNAGKANVVYSFGIKTANLSARWRNLQPTAKENCLAATLCTATATSALKRKNSPSSCT
mgnify:CR=1 FL=1